MPLTHRKVGDPGQRRTDQTNRKLYESCDVCYFCPYGCTNYSPPPPPPRTASHRQFSTVMILIICGLGVVFLLFSYLIIARYRSINQRNSRRRNQSHALGNDAGFSENQGPVMDHHVWYIQTVGLPQSLIDAIPVFDYRRGEKMIGGSDHCPVCLSEFQENESLRLLPKCGHAFHVVCIDTWLGSHKNCPVCRSPVLMINNTDASVASSVDMGSDHPGSTQGPEFEANGSRDTGPVQENGGESRILSKKRAFRVLSDLCDRRVLEVDRELDRVRRSVSMDYSSDSVLVQASKIDEGCSDT
ncbi:hypothetical protein F511_26832 [Dorcoceras hygrometricum]|uniref:RING-type E3 ubiquitin transferase n=1 Tax=Dorcoceras hygrometricum TaxID=472368 RepID=A0A2Z7CTH3_9LAMI|nr:hypothetical protein F511_26832 [Dorcoceras hygrometricum]